MSVGKFFRYKNQDRIRLYLVKAYNKMRYDSFLTVTILRVVGRIIDNPQVKQRVSRGERN